ncbi:MAG TPA: serine hydrolase [Thermomicrobiales bacterium]|nr:serine hydrolase [Thermomicrobiales bacterium]
MVTVRSRDELDQRLARIVSRFSGELSIAAKNLKTGEEILIDADSLLPTASSIKLSILVELYAQVAEGSVTLDERIELQSSDQVGGSGILKEFGAGLQPSVYDLATVMIVLSDNTATNMLIDRLGGTEVINDRIQGEYGLASIALHNRIDFEKIGSDVRRLAEATPADLMRLMEKMIRGEFVSRQASDEMLAILKRQQYLDQVPRYLNFSPYARELQLEQDINVHCKTGFFPGTRVDAGAIYLPDDVSIAYGVVAHESRDLSIAPESEAAIINGLVGREIVAYWWPRADHASAVFDSAYAEL